MILDLPLSTDDTDAPFSLFSNQIHLSRATPKTDHQVKQDENDDFNDETYNITSEQFDQQRQRNHSSHSSRHFIGIPEQDPRLSKVLNPFKMSDNEILGAMVPCEKYHQSCPFSNCLLSHSTDSDRAFYKTAYAKRVEIFGYHTTHTFTYSKKPDESPLIVHATDLGKFNSREQHLYALARKIRNYPVTNHICICILYARFFWFF